MAESASYNRTAQAHELTKSVKGEEKLRINFDKIKSVYSQLEALKRLTNLTMRDVEFISDLLPTHLKIDWRREYRNLSPDYTLPPFTLFMKFLERCEGS